MVGAGHSTLGSIMAQEASGLIVFILWSSGLVSRADPALYLHAPCRVNGSNKLSELAHYVYSIRG